MGAIKLVAIAVAIVFLIVIIVTNSKLREIVTKILNKRILKTKIFVKDVLAIISILVILVISILLLRKSGRILSLLIRRENLKNQPTNETENIIENVTENEINL